jgi:hypothetical protein
MPYNALIHTEELQMTEELHNQLQELIQSANLTPDVANSIHNKVIDFMIKAYNLGYEDAKSRYATVYPAEVMEIFNENSKKDT